ncbi:SPOR domain-containing protein [Roseovarius nubinhibens]|uniref:SPOR domain-containing protein n=1 Tax=Roseovarius nubinhibens TaxID=314263 RepID=UPI001C094E52|nr:SPOR domain-containing protein [Roseovarius nubinhibens]MBU3001322.1 SPOR domain-containing protein [Roseovarius nubinhibens]
MAQMQAPRPMAATPEQHPGHPLEKATYLVGAALSLGLVVGMVVWGVNMMTRDLSGVPVIQASKGPMRIQPEDPGGQQARNQGLSVNDVAAVGTAAAPADRLVLAPEPLDLTFEEVPAGTAPGAVVRTTPAAPAKSVKDMSEAEILALAESLAEGAEPLETLQPASLAVEAEEAEPVAALATDGLARSLRPLARPAALRQVASAEPGVAAAATGSQDVDPESIPVGTRLAQLGAYKSEAIAREEWARLEARFGDYLDGKNRVIQKATSGGRTFYRLRAMGFDDLAEARRFCSALVAERAECIPVVTR